MLIDFSPTRQGDLTLYDFAIHYTMGDLRQATEAYFDTLFDLINQASDDDIVFAPSDPEAYDPFAKPGEEHIGWGLGHLVAHVTATLEEGAAYSSILARGLPYPREPRLRYETPWQTIATQEAALQRLAESRRICLSYLATWPDTPFLDVLRDVSPRYIERNGPQNAPAAYLSALRHLDDHLDQFREVYRQARAAAEGQSAD